MREFSRHNLEKNSMRGANDGVLDVLFRNATIIDGTGMPSFIGDVGIQRDRIALVRPFTIGRNSIHAQREIDCEGMVLTPGFIDIHNHSDTSIFNNPDCESYVSQGVTTILVGQCGNSGAPRRADLSSEEAETDGVVTDWQTFAQYLDKLERLRKVVNIGSMVGHSDIRAVVMGLDNREPAESEMCSMKECVSEAMEAGAFGLSTGLIYSPGTYAKTSEIIELAKIVAEHGGFYATHLRSESDLEMEAIMEAIEISRVAGCRLQVSHLKASGKKNWGLLRTILEVMEHVRRSGIEVTCDIYPFVFQGQGVFSLLPPWARDGGKRSAVKLLTDPSTREKIRFELSHSSLEWENDMFNAGFDALFVRSTEKYPQYLGKSLAAIAQETGKDPIDAYFMLAQNDIDIMLVAGGLCAEDLECGLKHRLSMIASDGKVQKFGKGSPHPRTYCTFTRAITRYARDEAFFTLEDAINKMTGFPAWKMGLADRGVIRPGAAADITVFDYWRLNSKSDFGDPHHYTEGVVYVLVNGQFVRENESTTKARPGCVLRRP